MDLFGFPSQRERLRPRRVCGGGGWEGAGEGEREGRREGGRGRGARLSSEGREGCLGPHNPSCALSRFTDEEAGQRKAKRVATITRT